MSKFLPTVSILLLLGSATVSAQGTPSAVDNDVAANDSAFGASMDEDQRALADGNDDSACQAGSDCWALEACSA